MGLFGESNNSFLGIDIGSSSIKVVELKKKKVPGIHFYILNKSYSIQKILEELISN